MLGVDSIWHGQYVTVAHVTEILVTKIRGTLSIAEWMNMNSVLVFAALLTATGALADDDREASTRALLAACSSTDAGTLKARCYPVYLEAFNAALKTFNDPSNGTESKADVFLCLPVIRDLPASFAHYVGLTSIWLKDHPEIADMPARDALNKATLDIYSCPRSRRFHPN
jgi:hypothetical protein